MTDNKYIWNLVKQPPKTALKTINAGRLKGKSDINPQWRYDIMTEVFGLCGEGWKYTIDKLWTEPAASEQVFVFAQVSIYLSKEGRWLDPIQGIGGSMLVAKETSGLHSNDEGYKMAVTDALGTAMKMIGVAADIYAGKWDGSKYINQNEAPEVKTKKIDDVPNFDPPSDNQLAKDEVLGKIKSVRSDKYGDNKDKVVYFVMTATGTEFWTINPELADKARSLEKEDKLVKIKWKPGRQQDSKEVVDIAA